MNPTDTITNYSTVTNFNELPLALTVLEPGRCSGSGAMWPTTSFALVSFGVSGSARTLESRGTPWRNI